MTTPPTPPPFVELPRYTKDNMPLGEWLPFNRRTPAEMIRMTGSFVVETREGTVVCLDGWIARDSAGYPYPIAADEQAASWEPVPTPKD